MRINPISLNSLKPISINTNSSRVLNTRSSNDIFLKTTSFSGAKDDKSFEEFKKWADETDFLSKAVEIVEKTGDILGSGYEGTTYSIPNNERWVIKEYKRSSVIPDPIKKPEIHKIKDISPDLNIGQFVASVKIPVNNRMSHHMYILKKQTGRSYGVPHAANKIVNDSTAKMHIDSLKTMAKMPMTTYETLIDDIRYVTKRGYKFDTDNPYNFMVDTKKQRINFVDIADKLEDKDTTQYGDVLFALLDSDFAQSFKESDRPKQEKDDARIYSYRICSKFLSAMIRKHATFSYSKNFTKVFVSEPFEKTLGTSLPDKKIEKLKELGLY